MQQQPSGKEKFLQKLSTAIYNLRYILLSILAVFVIVVITWAIVAKVTGDRIETSTILVEKAEELFNNYIDEEDEETASKTAEDLIISLDRILEDYPKLYAAQRALHIKGSFHFRSENWDLAAETFLDLADRFSDSYLAPIAGINAAVSYEEAENYQEAISAYTMVIDDFIDVSPEIPRVFFALGRLTESTGNDKEKALEYYNQLVENYPSSSWTNLARDRIIYLKID
jgi:tetratricopeptide (TPR) repeat protein